MGPDEIQQGRWEALTTMGKIKDLRGRRFGRLTVPNDAKPVMRHGHAYWPVLCDCCLQLCPPVRGTRLRNKNTVSCGCWRADSEVRSQARRGPLSDDHYDDALEAGRLDAEAYREAALQPGDLGTSGEFVKPDMRPAAPAEPPLDDIDRAIFGDEGAPAVPPTAPKESPKDASDKWIDGDADEP